MMRRNFSLKDENSSAKIKVEKKFNFTNHWMVEINPHLTIKLTVWEWFEYGKTR